MIRKETVANDKVALAHLATLKAQRLARGLSQAALAKLSHLSDRVISDLETRPDEKIPRLSVVSYNKLKAVFNWQDTLDDNDSLTKVNNFTHSLNWKDTNSMALRQHASKMYHMLKIIADEKECWTVGQVKRVIKDVTRLVG